MSLFSLDGFHSVLIYLINFAILSYFCDGQGSIVRDSLEIEDVDEGSIFYANSTRLAVQVSSFLNLHLSLFYIFTNICSVAIQMIIYWYYLLGWWQEDSRAKCFCTNSTFMPNNSWLGYCPQSVWCTYKFIWRPIALSCLWQVSQEFRQVMNKLLRLLKFQDVLLSYLSLVNACIVFMYMHLKSSRLKWLFQVENIHS